MISPGSTMYRLFMEGDFGQDDMVFLSPSSARAWAKVAYSFQDIDDDFDDFWDDMCGTNPILVA